MTSRSSLHELAWRSSRTLSLIQCRHVGVAPCVAFRYGEDQGAEERPGRLGAVKPAITTSCRFPVLIFADPGSGFRTHTRCRALRRDAFEPSALPPQGGRPFPLRWMLKAISLSRGQSPSAASCASRRGCLRSPRRSQHEIEGAIQELRLMSATHSSNWKCETPPSDHDELTIDHSVDLHALQRFRRSYSFG